MTDLNALRQVEAIDENGDYCVDNQEPCAPDDIRDSDSSLFFFLKQPIPPSDLTQPTLRELTPRFLAFVKTQVNSLLTSGISGAPKGIGG